MSGIRPALTREFWGRRHKLVQCFTSWEDERDRTGVAEIHEGPGYLRLTSHEDDRFVDFSAPEDRHALAALALHGQEWGFTWEDVDLLRWTADSWTGVPFGMGGFGAVAQRDPSDALRDLAARIAALLPPRETP